MLRISPVVAFLLGVIPTTLAALAINSGNRTVREVKLRSDVHIPLLVGLQSVVATYDEGNDVLAERKVRLLYKRWEGYLDGTGRPPELFISEIEELSTATTTPTE